MSCKNCPNLMTKIYHCGDCFTDLKDNGKFVLTSTTFGIEDIYNVIDGSDKHLNIFYVCKGCKDVKDNIIPEEIYRRVCVYYFKEGKNIGLITMYNGKGSFWPGFYLKKLKDIPYKFISTEKAN